MQCPRIRVALCLSALLWLSCVRATRPASTSSSESLRYHISYVREPEPALDVEVMLLPGAPRLFRFTQPGGVATVVAHREDGERLDIAVVDGAVRVPPDVRILRYRYALGARGRARGMRLHTGMGDADAWHVAGRAYLLRPHEVSPHLRAQLRVTGADALLPWLPDASGAYHLRGEDLVDSGFHGFGGRRCRVVLSDAVMDVALLGHFSHVSDARVCGWLEQAATEVRTVRRSFPHPRISVRVVSVPRRDEPLFGMVLWSSPPSISLLLGQDATEDSFTRDWVALHEMLHLAHPALLPRVPWLSEGLATYFTELARARSGRQSAGRAWEELVDGFARGKRAAGERTMEAVVSDSDVSQGTYWCGALFALHLDVEIRRVTGNRRRLEDVLEWLAERGTTSTLGAFGVAVDAVAGEPLFESLLARHLPRRAFVEQEGLLEALGVTVGVAGVTLVEARDSTLRETMDGTRTSGVAR